MRKNKFKYRVLLFLYAYINQADLSLDRSRWDSLKTLRTFYEKQIAPERVAHYLLNCIGKDVRDIQGVCFLRNPTFLDRIECFFSRIFFEKLSLSDNDICFICQKLLLLSDYLNSDVEFHKLEIEKLRVEVSSFNWKVLKCKIKIRDLEKAAMVEHYLQNDQLKTYRIDEFSKGLSL